MNTVYLTSDQIANDTQALFSDSRKARLMANITARASRLFEVGYTATETLSGLYVRVFRVTSPEGKKYDVKISQVNAAPGSFFASRCSCPCFAEHDTCKHLQGVALMLAQEDAQVSEYEARMTDAETGTGCDAYARF